MKNSARRASLAVAFALIGAGLASWSAPQEEVPSGAGDVRFAAFDVFVDSGARPLAAWQVEIVDTRRRAKLVGVEGGDAGAFAAPPHYDPKALMGERIVLAAFDTGERLPEGRARVARVHVEIQGAEEPRFEVRLVAAATSDGSAIEASVSVQD